MLKKRKRVWIEHVRDIPALMTLMNHEDIKVYAPPEMKKDLERILFDYMTPAKYTTTKEKALDVYL